MRTLTLTLTLAEPAGYIRLLVDEGEPMRLALVEWRLAADRQPGTAATLLAYADKLDHAFHAAAPSAPSTTATTTPFATPLAPSATLIEPLTDREIDVLRLVTAGFSNAAIAAQLVVSVGTVKTHLKHIYGKLAVQSRTQAVAQARTLHLL
jgi:LuxR family maltose regulon positive regulatory protein